MSTSLDDALNGVTEEVVPDAPVEAAETPAEPEAPAVADEPAKADEPAPEPEPKTVPLAAMQEERTKRQELERRLAAVEKPAEPAAPPPDIFEQPDQVMPYIKSQIDGALLSQRMEMSRAMAIEKHGADAVAEAYEAINQPGREAEAARLTNSAFPAMELMKWHAQQKLIAEIGDNPTAWREAETARIRQQVEAELAVKQTRTPAPPSMANQPNLGDRSGPAWAGPETIDQLLG